MTTKHYFNIQLAKDMNLTQAVVYENLKFMLLVRKEHDINHFLEVMPYLGKNQIRASLNRLKAEGYIDFHRPDASNKHLQEYKILK